MFTTTIGTPLDPEVFGKTRIQELRHSCASLLLAMGVRLEVVSETLGHASIRITMDVYGHLLAPARMKAADSMRKAPSIEEMPDFDPLATKVGYRPRLADPNDSSEQGSVGRPGLDPGTLGLKVLFRALRLVAVRLIASQNGR